MLGSSCNHGSEITQPSPTLGETASCGWLKVACSWTQRAEPPFHKLGQRLQYLIKLTWPLELWFPCKPEGDTASAAQTLQRYSVCCHYQGLGRRCLLSPDNTGKQDLGRPGSPTLNLGLRSKAERLLHALPTACMRRAIMCLDSLTACPLAQAVRVQSGSREKACNLLYGEASIERQASVLAGTAPLVHMGCLGLRPVKTPRA